MSLPNPTSFNFSSLPEQKQGIQGKVVRVQGNQMPRLADTFNEKAPQPITTNVWIFSGRIASQGTRWSISEARQHPKLIGWVTTDETGKFSVGLPAGEYTLFAEDGDDLYLNSFLGDGNYGTVKVNKTQITETLLVNTEAAVF